MSAVNDFKYKVYGELVTLYLLHTYGTHRPILISKNFIYKLLVQGIVSCTVAFRKSSLFDTSKYQIQFLLEN